MDLGRAGELKVREGAPEGGTKTPISVKPAPESAREAVIRAKKSDALSVYGL